MCLRIRKSLHFVYQYFSYLRCRPSLVSRTARALLAFTLLQLLVADQSRYRGSPRGPSRPKHTGRRPFERHHVRFGLFCQTNFCTATSAGEVNITVWRILPLIVLVTRHVYFIRRGIWVTTVPVAALRQSPKRSGVLSRSWRTFGNWIWKAWHVGEKKNLHTRQSDTLQIECLSLHFLGQLAYQKGAALKSLRTLIEANHIATYAKCEHIYICIYI